MSRGLRPAARARRRRYAPRHREVAKRRARLARWYDDEPTAEYDGLAPAAPPPGDDQAEATP